MKQFFEFVPLVIFFIVYKMVDIYMATAALMIITGLMLAFNYFKFGKVEKMHMITFLMILVFGGFTLILQDDLFIKWKVTVVYGLFAIALLVSQWFYKKPIIKQMLGKELSVPDNVWNTINFAWALFFVTLGVLNLYVAFNLPQDVWVNFKVFGLLGLTLTFTVLSGLYLYKYLPAADKESEE